MKHTQGKVESDGREIGQHSPNTYKQIAKCDIHGFTREEAKANADRFAALFSAADGKTNEQAVKYLECGAEMVNILAEHCLRCTETAKITGVNIDCKTCSAFTLMEKLER